MWQVPEADRKTKGEDQSGLWSRFIPVRLLLLSLSTTHTDFAFNRKPDRRIESTPVPSRVSASFLIISIFSLSLDGDFDHNRLYSLTPHGSRLACAPNRNESSKAKDSSPSEQNTEEHVTIGSEERYLQLSDVRIPLIFMILFNVAFFGTGNFASITSFEISSVYRFITIFSPFLMAALLIFKLFIPFMLVIHNDDTFLLPGVYVKKSIR
ncbi:GPI ethanolamine phosphate transferase 1 protein [Raphanus sativus]|nr:GPI ethanolamine phosphate transferase 1 protein [Raphanus sativus]